MEQLEIGFCATCEPVGRKHEQLPPRSVHAMRLVDVPVPDVPPVHTDAHVRCTHEATAVMLLDETTPVPVGMFA